MLLVTAEPLSQRLISQTLAAAEVTTLMLQSKALGVLEVDDIVDEVNDCSRNDNSAQSHESK
jgi:hypothetical protein